MKIVITILLALTFSSSFSQWSRVTQLPASTIVSIYHKNNILYAGGINRIYFSMDKGLTWDSTRTIPQFNAVENIIVYKNDLYASSSSSGIFKSTDGGNNWENINAGIFPHVSDLAEWRGDLYASTLGSSMFKLDPASRNRWIFFSNGLSSISANCTSLAGNDNALVAGTLANGLYDHLPANTTTWEERFLLGQIRPTEGTYDIITAHDTLLLSGRTGRFYMSIDNGLNWNIFGNILPSLTTSIANARQALVLSRLIFDGINFHTAFYYIKKDSLQHPFVNFSFLPNHFSTKVEIFGNKLWNPSSNGLFYMSLSALPGITDPEDSIFTVLPTLFTLFKTKCETNGVSLTWKTAQEQNSSHFNIEKNTDGVHWTAIGELPAAGNSNAEKTYTYTDNNTGANDHYRIAVIDLDGKAQYSATLKPGCTVKDIFTAGPNPVHDILHIDLTAAMPSPVIINIFDSRGTLVKIQKSTLLQGINRLNVDMRSLPNGIYFLSAAYNNEQTKKTARIIKQ